MGQESAWALGFEYAALYTARCDERWFQSWPVTNVSNADPAHYNIKSPGGVSVVVDDVVNMRINTSH